MLFHKGQENNNSGKKSDKSTLGQVNYILPKFIK